MVLDTQKSQPELSLKAVIARRSERRSRPRAPLECTVHISRNGGRHPIASRTKNLSSRGFYCLVTEPLESGEHVECTLVIPIPKSGKPDHVLWLKCRVRVLRVEPPTSNREFGTAFLMEEYCVVHLTERADQHHGAVDGDGNAKHR